MILSQKDLSFSLVCIIPPDSKRKILYEIPSNVVEITNIPLQILPAGRSKFSEKEEEIFASIEMPLLKMQHNPTLENLRNIKSTLDQIGKPIGANLLMNSILAWRMLVRMYLGTMGYSSFLNYFWTWRGLMGSFYSIMLADIPQAEVYHALCTGYAGLFLARAHIEMKKPCVLTEHGIYTNERRIEIASAEWLYNQASMNLSIERLRYERDLKDYWIDTFSGYSNLSYEAASIIITLFKENQEFQLADGADPSKLKIIPNGIHYDFYSSIKKEKQARPTIALIGRVVPIKDTKAFINTVHLLKNRIPNIQAFIVGPTEEDPEYYEECCDLVKENHLEDNIIFTGKVNAEEIYKKIDVLVLTSLSESQPLVILEAGAAGIPCVATNVGSCRELIYGREDEKPKLGRGGAVCPLKDPNSMAEEIYILLSNEKLNHQYGQNLKERVKRNYQLTFQDQTYHDLYMDLYRT